MCYPTRCRICGKTTWAGCGRHAEMVMSRVAEEERCTCPRHQPAQAKSPNSWYASQLNANRSPSPAAAAPVPVPVRHVKTPEEFRDVVNSECLAVVDFYATWCAPCKQMAPVVDAMAAEFGEDTLFAKVNGDDLESVIESEGVSAFPTFRVYRGGRMLAEVVGVDKAGLRKAVETHLRL
eukprot:m51a1_g12586 putative thioredoxin h2-like (179) ;mRNA; r:1507-2534